MPDATEQKPETRTADDIKVVIQEKHHIIRQFVLSNPGEATDIGEQHGDLLLLPGEVSRLGKAVSRLRICWQEGDHRQVARWPYLAGQPDIRRQIGRAHV